MVIEAAWQARRSAWEPLSPSSMVIGRRQQGIRVRRASRGRADWRLGRWTSWQGKLLRELTTSKKHADLNGTMLAVYSCACLGVLQGWCVRVGCRGVWASGCVGPCCMELCALVDTLPREHHTSQPLSSQLLLSYERHAHSHACFLWRLALQCQNTTTVVQNEGIQ